MLIDGRAIAREITESLAHKVSTLVERPLLSVFVLSSDAATQQFIKIKKRTGESVGVDVRVLELPESTTTDALVAHVREAVAVSNGIIVQLPLPAHIDFKKIQDTIPASHDVDGLGAEARTRFENGDMSLLPPVVGACKEILEHAGVDVAEKNAVVVGRGLLVGGPMATWLSHWGARVAVVERGDTLEAYTHNADILVLGAGAPHVLKPNMIKDGVVILDAGTSEAGGKVVGDADPECAQKASVMTPVPGGVGPIAIAMLFHNLLLCVKYQSPEISE
ncbi:bifunctional 5,10-methylenetetrahydrofolate dehydrogenase/5,10-methenyltetrahydrofolate cyclohydrolase [Candidatus Campbellbacteria bacterium]|nr:MAG: bifunctional 5,10-methylenetetrahydrofolate dehydrogenase/5,10-methenyltetrahydrofolate cyclohydrolase [Candidatus Campbellbacteria bacterium]